MSAVPPQAVTTVTELRRTAGGTLVDGPTTFRWTGSEHSGSQNELNLHLMVTTVRKNMPGSNRVVEHALSATWQPFDISGEWDDKWGNRIAPSGTRTGTYAWNMFIDFAKFVSLMRLTRVEIDALSFTGLITDLKLAYRTKTKIGWTATLSPHENSVVSVPVQKIKVSQSIPKWTQDATDLNAGLKKSFDDTLQLQLKTPRRELFVRNLLEINDSITRLNNISFESSSVEEQQLLLLATTFRRLRQSSIEIWRFTSGITSSDDVAFEDVIQSMKYAEWISGTGTASWRLAALARNAELDVKARARQRPKAIYYPKKNEPLERISLKFYGTAANWRQIYDKNNLSSLVLTGTEELIIPELRK